MEGDLRIYRRDRWHLAYETGERKLTLPVEDSADGTALSVYLGDVQTWDPPDDDADLTDDDRARVRRGLAETYAERGVTVEFDPTE